VATMNQRVEPLQKASYYARSRRRMPNTEAPAGNLVIGSTFLDPAKDRLIETGKSDKHRRNDSLACGHHRVFLSTTT
jgi:hypothetical protein